MTLAELKQRYNGIAKDMRALNEDIGDKQWTDEQRTNWDAMKHDLEGVKSQIEREEELRANDQRFVEEHAEEQRGRQESQRNGSEKMDPKELRTQAFDAFVRSGMNDMTQEQRQLLREMRAQATDPGEVGGYTVPTTFRNVVIETMKDYGGIASVAQILNTDNGRPIEWPTSDGTGDEGELIGENQQTGEQDVEFGIGSLGAHKLSSKIIRVSNELLQDSGIDMEQYLGTRIGSRLGRAEARYLIKGTGEGTPAQPKGLEASVTASAGTAKTSDVTFKEINALIHTLDPAYRRATGFRLAMNDSTLELMEDMTDANGRPLWMPGLIGGAPATFLTYQYVIDQGIASIASGAKFLYAGDFKQFIIRRVTYMTLKRLVERYADYDQTGFLAFARFGCVLQDTSAIKALQGGALSSSSSSSSSSSGSTGP